jgi:alpha-tubulin suppressor-like RCC1 family protein
MESRLVAAITVLAAVVSPAAPPLRAGAETAIAIANGQYHSCAITSSGAVRCWGENGSGQLGDGNRPINAYTPQEVVGIGDATAIAAGHNHTCAIDGAGGLACWGYNGDGRLGDGTTAINDEPVDVVGLASGVTAVAAGQYHTCAITGELGGLKCWGGNGDGQLGDGTTTNRSEPVDVVGLSAGVVAVATGAWHTCAVMNTGSVKCWGYNYYGQLGNGTTTDVPVPVDVLGVVGATAVSAGGHHSCTLALGGVQCWGFNGNGQLGDGTNGNYSTATAVDGLASGVASISAGVGYSCAVTDGGEIKCWGANFYGQLGDGTAPDAHNTPVDVLGLTGPATAVSAGGAHTCGLVNAGVLCWGLNSSGQLGSNGGGNHDTPVGVVPEPGFLLALATGAALLAALARRRSLTQSR